MERGNRVGGLMMSGPKYSQFELEQRRQQELERQRKLLLEEERRRREEEQKKKELSTTIIQLQAKLQGVKGKISENAKKQLELTNELHLHDSYLCVHIQGETEKILTEINAFPLEYEKTSIPRMQTYLTELQGFLKVIKQEVNLHEQNTHTRLQSEIQKLKAFEQQQSFLEQSSQINVKKKNSYTLPKRKREVVVEENHHINISQVMQEALEELEPYIECTNETIMNEVKSLSDSIHHIYNNEKLDTHHKMKQIKQRVKTLYASKIRYDQMLKKMKQDQDEYEKFYIHYQSICDLVKVEPNLDYQNPNKATSSMFISQLKEEITKLDLQYAENHETEYIVQSVNEVMASLGYDIIATDYMVKKKQNVHHNLFEFGENQAVIVFVSDNGSVLFEVSGISEGPKELLTLEKLKVKEAMDVFCTSYDDIKEGLKQKGIFLNNENLSAADEKYVRNMDISTKNKAKQTAKSDKSKRRCTLPKSKQSRS